MQALRPGLIRMEASRQREKARVEAVTGGRQADTRNCFGQLQYKEPKTGAWMTVETYQTRYMRDVARTRAAIDEENAVEGKSRLHGRRPVVSVLPGPMRVAGTRYASYTDAPRTMPPRVFPALLPQAH